MIRQSLKQAYEGGPPQRCPVCDESLAAEQINLQEGVALCPQCGVLSRLSELTYSERSVQEILDEPPPGCTIEVEGQRLVARASCRSAGSFLGAAAVAIFWNSIVSVFVLLTIAGLYANLVGPLPDWFPGGVMGGKPRVNDGPMDLGMALFLCLFLTPFVLIGNFMMWYMLLYAVGKVEVVIDETDSHTAVGVGFLRWKRRFDPRQVHWVKLGTSRLQSENGPTTLIELRADRTIKFGSPLPAERMEWLIVVLKQLLLRSPKDRRTSTLPPLTWLS